MYVQVSCNCYLSYLKSPRNNISECIFFVFDYRIYTKIIYCVNKLNLPHCLWFAARLCKPRDPTSTRCCLCSANACRLGPWIEWCTWWSHCAFDDSCLCTLKCPIHQVHIFYSFLCSTESIGYLLSHILFIPVLSTESNGYLLSHILFILVLSIESNDHLLSHILLISVFIIKYYIYSCALHRI